MLHLQEKQSAYEKRNQRLQLKASLIALWKQSHGDAHLAQRTWPQYQSNEPSSHLKHYTKQNHD